MRLQHPARPSQTFLYWDKRDRYLYLTARFLASAEAPLTIITPGQRAIGIREYLLQYETYGRLAFSEPHVHISPHFPQERHDATLVTSQAMRKECGEGWQHVVIIEEDLSCSASTPNCWKMPYGMHPLVYHLHQDGQLEKLRQTPRTVRLFFAGNVALSPYATSRSMRLLGERFGLISRPRAILTLLEKIPDDITLLYAPPDFDALALQHTSQSVLPQTNKLVMALDPLSRISFAQWLPTLAHCDVFLTLPGISMPFSHNAVEAMAMGCIPLTNYGEWFDPPLEHMQTCIAFTDEADLVDKARMVLAMDENTLRTMRAKVVTYYEQYLAPETFGQNFRNYLSQSSTETMLLINTENAEFFARVTAHSLVFQPCRQQHP